MPHAAPCLAPPLLGRVALALAALAAPAFAAEVPPSFLVQTWQTSEGMPHNSPTCTAQDADGYLWIGTSSGVARFDGIRFETYRRAEGLLDNRVLCMLIDPDGGIWAGAGHGVSVRRHGRWQPLASPAPAGPVWSMARATDGARWFGTQQGAWRMADGGLARVTDGFPVREVRALLADPGGAMWMLASNGLFRWSDGRVEADSALALEVGNREYWDLQRDGQGRLIACGTGFLLARDGEGWTDLSAGMPDAGGVHVRCLPTGDGALWVATRNRGLACRSNQGWLRLDMTSGLPHDDVRHLAEDREGNLWVGTNGGGICRLKPRALDIFGAGSGLGHAVTTALVTGHDGTIWAGTDGAGVLRYANGRFSPGLPADAPVEPYVWSLCATRDGTLWIGGFQHGLLGWRDGHATILDRAAGLADSWIPALAETRDGALLIGTHNGAVQRWAGGRLTTLQPVATPPSSPITALLEDRHGALWVATAWNGLWRLANGRRQVVAPAPGLPSHTITALHEDAAGRLWIGTASKGLSLLDGATVHRWDTSHGLVSDAVVQILTDAHDNLWLGTDSGLQRVEIGELQAVADGRRAQLERTAVFSRPEGLPTPQCTSGHGSLCCRDAAGGLWFALAAGAVRAPASPLPSRHAPLKLNIESVTAGGRLLWQHDSAGACPRLELTAPLRSLELRFTAPSFTAPDKLRFRYRMGGMDDAWQETPGSRVATYSSLPPGNFRFEVAAAYPGEPWTTPPASVVVVIRPRFWQTTLFKTTAAALIAAGVAMLARHRALLRVRRRLSALERERKLDAERSRIARDLHDDLGATLTEIGFLGTSGAAAAQSAGNRERLEAIVARARRMAKSLDEIVWTVNPDNDTLSSVVNYLCSRTEESLRAAGVRCRLEVADDLPRATLDSEIRHHLLMAVNEAVNNVMKHAGANEARLRIRHGDGELELTVSDDGCGFDPAAVSPDRNGLRNLGARLAAIGGRFTVDSAPGAGTRIALAIPLIPSRRTAAHPPAWGGGQNSRSA